MIAQDRFRRGHSRGGLFVLKPQVRYKGSSGTNTVEQQSGPPAQVLANYNQVYNQAQQVANQPNNQYSGSLLAGFTPMQQAGFNDVNTAANAGQPFLNSASGFLNEAGTALDPSNFGSTVAQYQSPYTQSVVDATQKQFNNQNAIQQTQLAGNAASAGAFGGDRQAVAQAVLGGQQQAQEAPVIANLYNTGFQNATNAAQSGAWLNNAAGSGMASLGQLAQQQGLTAANAELGAGGLQQQQEQQELNIPYQAFLAAQGYPYQTTNWLEGMATGTGSGSGGTSSTTSPSPSGLSQVAGLGTAVVGGLGATGAFGNNGWLTGSGAGASAGGVGMSGVEQGIWDVARGGRIPGFAPGGEIPGDVGLTVNGIPQPSGGMKSSGLMGSTNNLLGGGGNLLASNTGTTSTTSGGGGDSAIGSLLKDAGIIAAGVYGGPAGGMAASYLSNQVHFDRGGKIGGLRGFDTGGPVMSPPSGLSASVGGNPAMVQVAQSYSGLPTEQLQELATRLPPNTPQGMMAQRALQQRHMAPGNNPAQAQVPGMAPMSQGSSMFARGGEAEDDDLPELLAPPLPGPSVPGGLDAGFAPMVAGAVPAERLVAPHAMPKGGAGGFVPPPPDLAPVVLAAADKWGVDPKPLSWMLSQESRWNPNAYNPSSDVGGIGQFKRATAAEMGIDRMDPHQAIDGSAHYLRTLLDKTGNDYERAIGRYGTFSTGHGKDADDAVRAKFRDFMGAARGGAMGLADGGDPDAAYPPDWTSDDAFAQRNAGLPQAGLSPMGDLPVPPIPPRDIPRAPRNDVSTRLSDGSGGSLPLPPPTQDGPKTGGFGAAPPSGEPSSSFKSSPWESVLTAGLGMMAGTSPFAAANIGSGALAGVKNYQQQRQLEVQDQMRADQAKTNAVWRAGQLGNLQDRTQAYKDISADRATQMQQNQQTHQDQMTVATQARQDALDQRKQEADLRRQEIEKGTFSFLPATQPDPDDPSKTISGMTKTNNKTGQVEFVPTNTNPNKPGAAGGMGGRDSVYFQRVSAAGNEAATSIKNIMELPTTATSGIFGGRSQGPGLLAAAKESLTNTLTSQGVQDYNSMVAGVSRNLSTIESAGLAPSGSLTHSMDALVLKEGDTEITKMRKLAEMRQIVEKGLEPNLSNPKVAPEQKQMLQGIIGSVQQAVPFTHHDITVLQNSKNPTASMNDLVKTKGLGAGQSAPSSGTPSPTYTAVGPGGVTIHSADGKTWMKPDGTPYAP